MYLSVIISKRSLTGMTKDSCYVTKHPYPPTPLNVSKRYHLWHHPKTQGCINAEEPHVTGKAVKHPAHECFLSRHPRQLPVSGITEVCEHQQHYTYDVMPYVCVVEHHGSAYAEKDRKYSNDIGMNTQPFPYQGKEESYRTRKPHIQPLLSILRLHRRA